MSSIPSLEETNISQFTLFLNIETDFLLSCQADFDFGDNVDKATFEQILDMDEEDDRDFSKSIVFGFLEQAEQTFGKMDSAM
jgi:hypothetical protein